MDKQIGRSYEFGPFHLDTKARRLCRGGEMVPLNAKLFTLLLKFVQDAGRTLSKAELASVIWPDRNVTDAVLSKNVSELKQILVEGREAQTYIETLAGRGYRFVARVEPVEEAPADAPCETLQLDRRERLPRDSTSRKLPKGLAESNSIRLVFQDGVFIPQEPCDLPEGSEVELSVSASQVRPPAEVNPEERKRILREVAENMRQHPFPENAPRFTREEMHERR